MKGYSRAQIAILKLCSVAGLTHRQKEAILALTADPAEVVDHPARYARELEKIGMGIVDKLSDLAVSFDEERFLLYMERFGAYAIFRGDADYPERLKVLDDAPIVLFCRGNRALLSGECFAVVGTRNPTRYGRDVTAQFAEELVEAGFIVVSGLARGVDAIAHRVALDREKPTIAVIGCGVDKVYPAENKDLYDRIAEKGLIVSEYFMGSDPVAFHFPERNRIISALSEGVLVTEAGEKSGAIITADCALDQGKDVFLVPGNIYSNQSKGTNEMLHNPQCMIATDPQDILDFYKKEGRKKEEEAASQLTTEEVIVFAALQDDDRHFEELLEITGLSMGELMATLTKLEVLGVIKKLPGNYYGV